MIDSSITPTVAPVAGPVAATVRADYSLEDVTLIAFVYPIGFQANGGLYLSSREDLYR
jgi:hypothetical protein